MIKKRPVCYLRNSGYTLIELMLVLAIASVVLLAAQRPLLEINRIALQELQKIALQGDFQRFLLLLKSELIQAGYDASKLYNLSGGILDWAETNPEGIIHG